MKRFFIKVLMITSLTIMLLKPLLLPTTNTNDFNPIKYTQNNKIDYTEAITERLEAIDKREIMQINLNNKFTLKSKYQNDFFKNNSIIEVFAIGVYILNSDYVILVNEDKYIINIKLETNLIESEINIKNDKGLLAIGDYKFTVEEAEEVRQKINENLLKEMNSEENLKAVKERTEQLLGEKEKYKVEVNWLK